MEATTKSPLTKEQIIEVQKEKLERVLKQIEPGLAVEIIRYGPSSTRILISQTYHNGNPDFYKNLMRLYFGDACKALREGQKLRIQLVRG